MGFTDRVAHTAYVIGLCASLGATGGAAAQLPPVAVPPNTILPNYERMPLGQRESIEAGAFVARTNDAGANWYNPAGLAQHKESSVNASATAYEWTRLILDGPSISTDRGTFKAVGTFFGVLLGDPPLPSERWRVGVSLTRPLAWRPGRTDAAFRLSSPGGEESFTPPNLSHVRMVATIIEGTGRFASATGTFTIRETSAIDFEAMTSVGTGSFEGTIKFGR